MSRRRTRAPGGRPQVVIANPSADVYGSDLQMLQSITALVQDGYAVTVTTPTTGPLVAKAQALGATVELLDYPVLRKAYATVPGLLRLAGSAGLSTVRLGRMLRARRPVVVYVNTVTLPWWIAAARLAGVRVLCHVHEAERQDPRPVRLALYLPLVAAHRVVVNSRVTGRTVQESVRPLPRPSTLVYNGVPGPAAVEPAPSPRDPFRLVLIARLSPRKGVDTALEAVALVRRSGHDVRLEVCGTPFPGYEWFETQLRERAEQEDLRGAVIFSGYVDPVWPALARAHAVLATSLGESLGNAVIEAQLAGRPVLATAVHGHLETVRDGETGLLVPPTDPQALADAITRLIRSPELAQDLAERAAQVARDTFGVDRYLAEITRAVGST